MQTLGFSFVLSGRIWDKVYELWETNVNKNQKKPAPEKYFNIHPDKFDKFLAQLSGDMFIDNKPEMIATLWGSVYVYDFLKTASVIDETVYNAFIQATKKLKGLVIGKFTSDLWNYNFVHHWPKPKSISELEFTNEEKIFSISFKFKERDFKEFKVLISDELKNIGELSEYIIEGAKSVQKQPDFSDIFDKISSKNIFDDDYSEQKNQKEIPPVTYIDPATLGNKVGRNDPCPCGSGKKYKKCCG